MPRPLHEQRNVKEFIDANGLKFLVDLMTLAHLHTSRAYVPTQVRGRGLGVCPVLCEGMAAPPLQTMSIEASASMKGESEKEWYHMTRERERVGPYSFQEVSRKKGNPTLTAVLTPPSLHAHPTLTPPLSHPHSTLTLASLDPSASLPPTTDEGLVQGWHHSGEDPLLGTGHGWLEAAEPDQPAQVVHHGNGDFPHERVRDCHPNLEDADPNV